LGDTDPECPSVAMGLCLGPNDGLIIPVLASCFVHHTTSELCTVLSATFTARESRQDGVSGHWPHVRSNAAPPAWHGRNLH